MKNKMPKPSTPVGFHS